MWLRSLITIDYQYQCTTIIPACKAVFKPHSHAHSTPLCAVAFRIYDIGHTGAIERSELKRFLIAVMADNPEVDFDESVLEAIVDAVREFAAASEC